MRKSLIQDTSLPGTHLRKAVNTGAFCGLFLSLFGSGMAWAGTESFHCSETIWKTSLALNLSFFVMNWAIYFPFRNSDRLLGNGLLAVLMFFSLFWAFGFAGFYFYFLFSPIATWLRIAALLCVTTMLIYRAGIIILDIQEAFEKNSSLFSKIYCDEGTSFACTRESFLLLQKSRRDRNPFKSIHAYAAIIVGPFVLVLNRVLAPVVGDGHGVFLVLAFFSVPILLWGIEIFVQTVMTMIYYPIKLERETGKPVLMKDW